MAVITISRLPGALGDTLAAALAERLQYRLVERAQLMQLCEQLVGSDLGWEARLNCASARLPCGGA